MLQNQEAKDLAQCTCWVFEYGHPHGLGCYTHDSLIQAGHCPRFTVRIVSVGGSFYLIGLECEATIILINPRKYVNTQMEHSPKASFHFVQEQDLHLNVKCHI